MTKLSIKERARAVYKMCRGKLKFISGKWFYDDTEIKDIHKYLYKMDLIDSPNQLDDVIESLKIEFGESGTWPELPIVKEAENLKEFKPLCYPLTEKQLIIINYLLRHDEEIFFILTGVGGSGKSTFANIICEIFDNDTASLSLSDLGEDFKLATGINCRLIYSTEINSDDINNGMLKQLFSNEEITINGKYDKPYKARCQSAFFFNCNTPPRLDLSDTGMLRRILYFSMNEKIKNPDKTLAKRKWTHADLVNIVAHALKTDMTNWQEKFQEETRYNLIKDNSVYRFKNIEDYSNYSLKCKEEGLKPFAKPKWENIRHLLEEWGYISNIVEIKEPDEMPF